MSSLKDIMDVDVEPLQSQAYRRAMTATQDQAALPSNNHPFANRSPLPEDTKEKTPAKRRRSDRASNTGGQASSSPSSNPRRRSSAAAASDTMDYVSSYPPESSNQGSMPGSPRQLSPKDSESAEMPLKYTPITGRISRAKKGVPVHTCDQCVPTKTFTRAEHLRRHRLSHEKPAYKCTFKNCERAFHRPDLLARHMHRHETQGEQPFISSQSRSRASSSPSESRTPPLKVETPAAPTSIVERLQPSPSDSITPRTSGPSGSSTTALGAMPSGYMSVQYPPASHKRTATEADFQEPRPYSATMAPGEGPTTSYEHDLIAAFPASSRAELSNHESSHGIYTESPNFNLPNYNTPHTLPFLHIPEENLMPSLSYAQDNSPWCSSASDSTYSTRSDSSRNGVNWGKRARSASVNTNGDWSSTVPQFPHGSIGAAYEPGLSDYDSAYTPPQMTPPTASRQLLNILPAFGGFNYGDNLETVGAPALANFSKPVAQIFPASPSSRLSKPRMAGVDRRQKLEPADLSRATTISLSYARQTCPLDMYLDSYWRFFNSFCPIVHRSTFCERYDDLLTSAMAAIGTQYHDTVEDRQKGVELNQHCRESIDLCPEWNVQTMQAILLTEIFTRFRGRKTTVRPSRQFEELYSRLISPPQPPLAPQLLSSPISATTLLDRFNPNSPTRPQQPSWTSWVESESRQRLLCLTYTFDIQASMLYSQIRCNSSLAADEAVYLPCPDDLWNAGTASEWNALLPAYVPQPLRLIENNLTSQFIANASPFTGALLTAHLASRLPSFDESLSSTNDQSIPTLKFQSLYSSTHKHIYLLVSTTPLTDLLAVSGDTWLFGRKITPFSAFDHSSKRLHRWSNSLAAANATQHACLLLHSTFSRPYDAEAEKVDKRDLSAYWGLYIAALVCWAFGHRLASSSSFTRTSHSPPSSSSSSSTAADDGSESPTTPTDDTRLRALAYINGMLSVSSPSELLSGKMSARADTGAVVDAVRARLELESVGSKSGMLVDAVGVLGRLREGKRSRRF